MKIQPTKEELKNTRVVFKDAEGNVVDTYSLWNVMCTYAEKYNVKFEEVEIELNMGATK